MTDFRHVRRCLAQLPLATSVFRRHLGEHWLIAAARVLRAIGRPIVTFLMPVCYGTVLEPLAHSAMGNHGLARQRLREIAQRRPDRAPDCVTAAIAVHEAEIAGEIAASLDADVTGARIARAMASREAGFFGEALRELSGANSLRSRRLRRQIVDELNVLAPIGRAEAASRPQQSSRPEPASTSRVLHLVTNALPAVQAGYTTRTRGITSAQRKLGLEPVVAPRAGFPVTAGRLGVPHIVREGGVTVHHSLPARWPGSRTEAQELDVAARTAIARLYNSQVLHAHSNYLNARTAFGVRDRLGLPVVYEVRGFLEETWRSRGGDPRAESYRLLRACETEMVLGADAVVTISESMRDDLIERGLPPDRCTVVPNAVDDRFLAEPPDATVLRSSLGIAAGELVLGTITTVNDYEGIDVLIDAVLSLRTRGVKARGLVVGAGPALAALRERAAPDPEAVVFTGQVPFADVRNYHAAIDVFVVPRLDLSVTARVTPIKPLEAMATAVPVIASDLPALREIVRDGVTGILSRAGDAEALADAAMNLRRPETRSLLGAQAREWVRTERTWAKAAIQYRSLYATLPRP